MFLLSKSKSGILSQVRIVVATSGQLNIMTLECIYWSHCDVTKPIPFRSTSFRSAPIFSDDMPYTKFPTCSHVCLYQSVPQWLWLFPYYRPPYIYPTVISVRKCSQMLRLACRKFTLSTYPELRFEKQKMLSLFCWKKSDCILSPGSLVVSHPSGSDLSVAGFVLMLLCYLIILYFTIASIPCVNAEVWLVLTDAVQG